MARSPRPQDITWFLDLYEKGQLNLDPPYQRRSVWSQRDRRFFVDTIMNEYPAPPVFLHKTLDDEGRPTYHVVDGKQRLQTIIDFTLNRITIPDDFADIRLQKKRWKDLGREERERFWNYEIVVEMLPDVSDVAVRNIFDRINRNSRRLTPQELRHARYDGWFISTVEAETEKQEWKKFGVVTPARSKRMADVQFLSELMSLTIRQEIQGFDQDALDDLYAEYDDLVDQPTFVEDDFRTAFEATKEYIRELLDLNPELVTILKVQSHFYSLWSYLTLETSRILPPEEFAPRYQRFLADVTAYKDDPSPEASSAGNTTVAYQRAVTDYAANIRGASTDLTPRRARHDALLVVMHGAGAAADEGQ